MNSLGNPPVKNGGITGTGSAPKLWQPVLRGHAVTGDIIAPIRKLGETKRKATHQDAAAIAEALVNIRTYFMPKRGKAEVLKKYYCDPVNAESCGLFVALTMIHTVAHRILMQKIADHQFERYVGWPMRLLCIAGPAQEFTPIALSWLVSETEALMPWNFRLDLFG
jgi:hypothetical protein